MAKSRELEKAFDAAIGQVQRALARGMTAVDGEPAESQLRKLGSELETQRDHAAKTGAIDRAWFQQTVRWMDVWVPETEITLIAALGRIARSATPPV